VAHLFQFDEKQPGRSPLCIACEEMLADALDKTLGAADQSWFDQHVDSCMHCGQMVADAERGAAWLEMLKSPRPEPSASLMERILAQTSGLEQTNGAELEPIVIGQPALLPAAMPVTPASNVLAFRPRLAKVSKWLTPSASFQPRLAMTAAMAFFSVALTLNLAGVRLDQLHASDLNPANMKRSYYEASANAVRYYDNLRVVRVMESRVDDLRIKDDDRPAPAARPEAAPETSQPQNKQPQQKQKEPNGSSRVETPFTRPRFQVTDGKAISARKFEQGGLV
jgi:hypothetical protein